MVQSSEKPRLFDRSGVWALWPSLSLYGTFDGQGHNQYIVIQKIGKPHLFVCLFGPRLGLFGHLGHLMELLMVMDVTTNTLCLKN